MALSVYQTSVLHSDWPLVALNGLGDRMCTTRPALRPLMARVTFLPSAESVAEETVSVSSSTFGPPYAAVGSSATASPGTWSPERRR